MSNSHRVIHDALLRDASTGSNLICTSIHKALTRLVKNHGSGRKRPHIDELYVQVDNASGENKNNVLLSYLGSLVGRGAIGRVEVNFMPVGHTHIKLDSIFSRCVYSGLVYGQDRLQASFMARVNSVTEVYRIFGPRPSYERRQ